MCAVNVGGIAGGVKYRCGDILLKLAVDEQRLYGGHDLAGKAAAHELKGPPDYVDHRRRLFSWVCSAANGLYDDSGNCSPWLL